MVRAIAALLVLIASAAGAQENAIGQIDGNRNVVIQGPQGPINLSLVDQPAAMVIELTVECGEWPLSLRISPGDTARVVRLNPLLRSRSNPYLDIRNSSEEPIDFPAARSEKMEVLARDRVLLEEENVYRCVLGNRGNVPLVQFAYRIEFTHQSQSRRRSQRHAMVMSGPIGVGEERVVFVAHDCPGHVFATFSPVAWARPPGLEANLGHVVVLTNVGESNLYLGSSSVKWIDYEMCPS